MKKTIFLFLVLGITACKRQFEPINYGHEACAYCKMTIMDKHFAAEILTSKGKAIKFDDLGCLLSYIKEEHFTDEDASIFVADYNNPDGDFLNARKAVYIKSDQLKSPMGGNYASSPTTAAANKLNAAFNSTLLNWDNLK
ncbi:MAG: nitrous oxide reductase accessory protein NosL [Bacteroidetes bacterium]|jgi:copper chaperone NosL|nr:nitrous oxide reductase accessory protein NosL [Bacteroidota bacterium]